ncbi:hypothetical protein Fmac_028082 [Flemingia macrophylla]|uniref:Uncharacterized protein n=1 Tax=Flemingia macrophylla TaxID=520843 RepID=A0ABD1LK56_9FABA
MGNQVSAKATGKIVLWDGSVQEIEQPVTVAELMLEHPQQVVVDFHSAVTHKRPTPLPADHKLHTNKLYLMLPVKRGKPVSFTAQDAPRIFLTLNSLLPSSSKFLPCLTRFCQTTTIVHPHTKDHQQTPHTTSSYFSQPLPEELSEATPHYLTRQLSSKASWKPTLDPIKEKNNVDTKLSHWLFLKT